MSDWIEVKKDEDEKEKTRFWEPEAVGEFIQGKYLDKEENVGQYKSNLYTIRTSEGEMKCWGSTVLDNLMEKVPLSCEVQITFKGKNPSKTGKKAWKDYMVKYREK